MEITENSSEEIQTEIKNLLDAFNRENVGGYDHQPITLSILKGEKLVAGLIGGTYWGYLYVDSLIVVKEHRNQGFGRELLSRAEEIAISRGCKQSSIDTHDFQGLEFYRKLGYKIVGKLPDLPAGYSKYHLHRRLETD